MSRKETSLQAGKKNMKILMVNKFLHPNGGSETYVFKVGNCLKEQGHEVQYFGMEHKGRCVGNHVNAYTSDMDFHGGSKWTKLAYPFKTVYSFEARKKIRLVLDDFQPDVVHINNFNYQLTPSILVEIRRYEKETKRKVRIAATAHDSQLVCPNHLMQNPVSRKTCMRCLGGGFINCVRGRCIHGSLPKSIIGAAEGWYWNKRRIYKEIDVMISPSRFLADKLSTNPLLKRNMIVLRNFVESVNEEIGVPKEDYILFFGRYSVEKGIHTLLKVIDRLPQIPFVFAGDGPLADEVNKRKNIINRGFLSGDELKRTIASASFTVMPSECFENCPFTVMESQLYGTPVLGADIGGIPELISAGRTGELFECGNAKELRKKIQELWMSKDKIRAYSKNCRDIRYDTAGRYCEKLVKLYQGEQL